MKRLKPLCALILIAAALLLSGASTNVASRKARPNQHQEKAHKKPESAKPSNPEPSVPLRDLETAQLATLNAIYALHAEQEARAKQQHTQYERWYAPAVLIPIIPQIFLIIIGIFYTRYAYRQWVAIKQQAK